MLKKVLLAAAVSGLAIFPGCNENDDNVMNAPKTGSISVTANFGGTVSDTTPIIIEIKEQKRGLALVDTLVTVNNTEVIIDNIPAGQYYVMLWYDEDNDRELDELDEPRVFYTTNDTSQAVGLFGDATLVTLQGNDSKALGTILFSG